MFLNFELTPFQYELLVKNLEQRAPGAKAEFTLIDSHDFKDEKIMRVDVIRCLKDSTEKRGKSVGFHNLIANERMTLAVLEDTFKR